MDLVKVFCWCGATIVGVTQRVIDNCATAECGPGCKERFERRGVRYAKESWRNPRRYRSQAKPVSHGTTYGYRVCREDDGRPCEKCRSWQATRTYAQRRSTKKVAS